MAKTTKESGLFEGFKVPKAVTKPKTNKKTEEDSTKAQTKEQVEQPIQSVEPDEPIESEKPTEQVAPAEPEIIVKKEPPVEDVTIQQSVAVKSGGRPKKYTGDLKNLKVYLPKDNYNFIKRYGYEFDGMNGFINHLIEEERRRRGE